MIAVESHLEEVGHGWPIWIPCDCIPHQVSTDGQFGFPSDGADESADCLPHQVSKELAVALAEKALYQQLTGRLQQMQLEERAAASTSRAKAEAEKADLGARLEALETALALERERATVAEGEAKLLLERALRAEVMMLDDR